MVDFDCWTVKRFFCGKEKNLREFWGRANWCMGKGELKINPPIGSSWHKNPKNCKGKGLVPILDYWEFKFKVVLMGIEI